MGNTSECTFLSNNDQHYRLLGEENHFLYGEIHHFITEQPEEQHFAIKKMKFSSQTQLKNYQNFIEFYREICTNLHLTKAELYVDPKTKAEKKESEEQFQKESKQNEEPIFHCNKENFIFSSPTEELSCTESSYFLNLSLQYLEEKNTLRSVLIEKSNKLNKTLENNKVNQNILIELESKVKLCEYEKIDKLPHKERSIVNLFFTEIEVLRILDSMLTSLYGLKINGFSVDAVRPELFFTSSKKEQVTFFFSEILELKNMGNLQKSYESVKKWLNDEKALFHHNWNLKEREYVSYIHPDNLEKLSEILLEDKEENFLNVECLNSREVLEKQNIFALGLMILQICLLEPFICSKLYTISTCKSQQKKGTSKIEMKYSFDRDNLKIKFNNSVLQKYLTQMKNRYSDEFVDLVEFMLEGGSKNLALINKTVYEEFNYESVIEKLSDLISENVHNLKEVYNGSHKSKSKAKESSQKESRKSSLTKQVSASNVSNHSLSSSSSLSLFPMQTQQKVSSVELLKKNCSRLETKVDKVLIKSELETLHESFVKKENNLESLISKDEERILSQLNRLNSNENFNPKQKRFGYRKIDDKNKSEFTNNNKMIGFENSDNLNFEKMDYQNYGDFKIATPASLLPKMDSISQEKEKRINSSSKIKKNILHKAKEEESMGNSVCQTIFLYKEKEKSEESIETVKYKNVQKDTNSRMNIHREVQPFSENEYENSSYKEELKNLMLIKDKKSKIKSQNVKTYENEEEKFPKELKSNELYEIYMKEYRNLVESRKKTEF